MPMQLNREEVITAVSGGWCTEKNKHKVMDSDLALAIVDNIMKLEQAETPETRIVVQVNDANELIEVCFGMCFIYMDALLKARPFIVRVDILSTIPEPVLQDLEDKKWYDDGNELPEC